MMTTEKELVLSGKWLFFQTYGELLDQVVKEDELENIFNDFWCVFHPLLKNVTTESANNIYLELKNQIYREINIEFNEGFFIAPYEPCSWVKELWKVKKQEFWLRYKLFLAAKGRENKFIEKLDRKTDEILDHCGNPDKLTTPWQIRGLVVGEVQSGKTGIYTALINKAADAGYKVIIVLTGITEDLRRQTLFRLETEFLGSFSNPPKGRSPTTVEKWGNVEHQPFSLTSTLNDFTNPSGIDNNFKLDSINSTVLIVIKKNARILENLTNWLIKYNADKQQCIHETLLLIDDEADNASINTRNSDSDPTKINQCLRNLLISFNNASYIGFTATPYANILIDPDEYEDLFPRDFICTTDIPSNYFGLYGMFGQENNFFDEEEDDTESPYIRLIYDGDELLPIKHKKNDSIKLNNSIKTAILQFLLVNAIRDLTGEKESHRTMMINVTRFTGIQNQLFFKVESYLKEVIDTLQITRSEYDPVIKKLKNIFFTEFKRDCKCSWHDILYSLAESTEQIKVFVVNSTKISKNNPIDYIGNSEEGVRAIVIGGFSLSRGLTLEGLTISYLYRTSFCADTLTQMGRWFGYHENYQQLCRVWMTPDLGDRFRQIAIAQSELSYEVQRMTDSSLTPEEFGLKIRTNPGSFAITSRNKMRSAEQVTITIRQDYNGKLLEAYAVKKDSIEENELATIQLFKAASNYCNPKKDGTNIIFNGIPKEIIADFTDSFSVDPMVYALTNFDNSDAGISKFIRETDISSLQTWDVAFIGNMRNLKEPKLRLNQNTELLSSKRTVKDLVRFKNGSVVLSKKRLTVPNDEAIVLDTKTIESHFGNDKNFKNKSRQIFRSLRKCPLLIIIPVILRKSKKSEDQTLNQNLRESDNLLNKPVCFYALSFCQYGDTSEAKKIFANYLVNKTWLRQHQIEELEEDDL